MTSVFPIFLMLNIAGAFTSYQSFLENGSTLDLKKGFGFIADHMTFYLPHSNNFTRLTGDQTSHGQVCSSSSSHTVSVSQLSHKRAHSPPRRQLPLNNTQVTGTGGLVLVPQALLHGCFTRAYWELPGSTPPNQKSGAAYQMDRSAFLNSSFEASIICGI